MNPVQRALFGFGVVAGLMISAAAVPAQQSDAGNSQATIGPTGLLDRPARLVVEGVTLSTALARLSHRAGVPLVFSETFLPKKADVACPCGSVRVAEALDRLLAGTGLRYAETETQIIIEPGFAVSLTASPPAQAAEGPPQPRQGAIAGQVTAAATESPLAGVQVSIPGTDLGRLTDASGRYQLINVPVGEVTVVAQFIGYRTAEQTVLVVEGETAQANFQLAEQAIALDEVVVTATGEQRNRELANAVAQISAADVTEEDRKSVV